MNLQQESGGNVEGAGCDRSCAHPCRQNERCPLTQVTTATQTLHSSPLNQAMQQGQAEVETAEKGQPGAVCHTQLPIAIGSLQAMLSEQVLTPAQPAPTLWRSLTQKQCSMLLAALQPALKALATIRRALGGAGGLPGPGCVISCVPTRQCAPLECSRGCLTQQARQTTLH